MRATLLLSSLLLLAGCGDAAVEAPSPVATPAAASSPAATPPPAVEPALPTPAPTAGQPFARASVREGSRLYDGFTFWGWSADGARYAFETLDPGPGAVECEGRYDLFVVDAASDRFVEGGVVSLKYDEPEPADGICLPRDLAGAWTARRDAALKAHGIVAGAHVEPAPYQAIGEDGSLWQINAPGCDLQVQFTVDTPGREAVMSTPGAGAAYTLKTRIAGGPWTVVEAGTRKRETVHDYSVGDASAFFSPDGRRGALFVARTHLSYEGDRVTFMSNGITLPAP